MAAIPQKTTVANKRSGSKKGSAPHATSTKKGFDKANAYAPYPKCNPGNTSCKK